MYCDSYTLRTNETPTHSYNTNFSLFIPHYVKSRIKHFMPLYNLCLYPFHWSAHMFGDHGVSKFIFGDPFHFEMLWINWLTGLLWHCMVVIPNICRAIRLIQNMVVLVAEATGWGLLIVLHLYGTETSAASMVTSAGWCHSGIPQRNVNSLYFRIQCV